MAVPAVVVLGLAWLGASDARACNTPVYRYAMYNWAPAPFFVFYFHHTDIPAEHKEVNDLITDLAQGGPALANVSLEPIDVSALPRTGRGYKEGAAILEQEIHRLWRMAAEAVIDGFPEQLPDGALRGCLDDESFTLAEGLETWPTEPWAEGPLGPVYKGP